MTFKEKKIKELHHKFRLNITQGGETLIGFLPDEFDILQINPEFVLREFTWFLSDTIDQAIAEERKEVMGWVKQQEDDIVDNKHYLQALSDLKDYLTKK